jgi:hypothetical protein
MPTKQAPESDREYEQKQAGEIRADLIRDPGAICGESAEVARGIFDEAELVWLSGRPCQRPEDERGSCE